MTQESDISALVRLALLGAARFLAGMAAGRSALLLAYVGAASDALRRAGLLFKSHVPNLIYFNWFLLCGANALLCF